MDNYIHASAYAQKEKGSKGKKKNYKIRYLNKTFDQSKLACLRLQVHKNKSLM